MSKEAITKREFTRMVNDIISAEPGGEIRLSRLYSILRNMGFHPNDIVTNLVKVGILIDQAANTASLESRPLQCTLDAMIF